MNSRIKLHEELCLILGSRNVYFQPPESIKIAYPAIIYSRTNIKNMHASNNIYDTRMQYNVTVVDKNPDSELINKLNNFNFSVYDRHYTSNGLNYDQFTITYK